MPPTAETATLHDVLTAARTVLAATPGLTACSYPPPDLIAEFPHAVLMPVEGDALMANRLEWTDRFFCDVFVERDNLPARVPVILPLLEAIVERVRTNVQLGGIVAFWVVTGYQVTQLLYNGQPYVGLRVRMQTRRIQHRGVSDPSTGG